MNMMAFPFFPLILTAVVIFILLRLVVFRSRSLGSRGWHICPRCGRSCEPHAGFCPRCGMRL
ncbi:MAG: zinc-ribbon domain-containing protein [Tepidisphaerales bacterium]